MGRKLHFLVSIIDKKDALIYKAQRKAHLSAQADVGVSGREGVPSPSLCLSDFLSENTFPGAALPLPDLGHYAPAA